MFQPDLVKLQRCGVHRQLTPGLVTQCPRALATAHQFKPVDVHPGNGLYRDIRQRDPPPVFAVSHSGHRLVQAPILKIQARCLEIANKELPLEQTPEGNVPVHAVRIHRPPVSFLLEPHLEITEMNGTRYQGISPIPADQHLPRPPVHQFLSPFTVNCQVGKQQIEDFQRENQHDHEDDHTLMLIVDFLRKIQLHDVYSADPVFPRQQPRSGYASRSRTNPITGIKISVQNTTPALPGAKFRAAII